MDTKTRALARQACGEIVPACFEKRVMGALPSLHVYRMDSISGITYIETPLKSLRWACGRERRCPIWQGY